MRIAVTGLMPDFSVHGGDPSWTGKCKEGRSIKEMSDEKAIDKIKLLEVELFSGDEKRYWKAAADACEYVQKAPNLIWPLVVKAGSSEEEDLRMAMAACVLEHLLGEHFEEYFPKVKELINAGNRNLRSTLEFCSKMDQSEEERNSSQWDELVYNSATPKEKESIEYWKEYKKYSEMEKRGDPEGVAGLKRLRGM
jgi:hypothetical protein